jgi:SSS family solute:Na+ symporter
MVECLVPGRRAGAAAAIIAQRMLAAKNESGAIRATLLFNLAHYALRPWPWIIVALASLIVFPGLRDLQSAFPAINADLVRHDLAYPAMLTLLPKGLLGVVLASLFAAYMSTVSNPTQLGCVLSRPRFLSPFYLSSGNGKTNGQDGPPIDAGTHAGRLRPRPWH